MGGISKGRGCVLGACERGGFRVMTGFFLGKWDGTKRGEMEIL